MRRQSCRLRNNWEGCHLHAMEPATGTADTSPTLLHTNSNITEKFHNNLMGLVLYNPLDSLPTKSRSPRLAPQCRLIPALYGASSNKIEKPVWKQTATLRN